MQPDPVAQEEGAVVTKASTKRYLNKRYRNDPEFRLKRINAARVRQGYPPLTSLDEARTTMKEEPDGKVG
jgi:hypothetical protein